MTTSKQGYSSSIAEILCYDPKGLGEYIEVGRFTFRLAEFKDDTRKGSTIKRRPLTTSQMRNTFLHSGETGLF